ncbi:hypothetical protein M3J09_006322 [Ascochyta lentis]
MQRMWPTEDIIGSADVGQCESRFHHPIELFRIFLPLFNENPQARRGYMSRPTVSPSSSCPSPNSNLNERCISFGLPSNPCATHPKIRFWSGPASVFRWMQLSTNHMSRDESRQYRQDWWLNPPSWLSPRASGTRSSSNARDCPLDAGAVKFFASTKILLGDHGLLVPL